MRAPLLAIIVSAVSSIPLDDRQIDDATSIEQREGAGLFHEPAILPSHRLEASASVPAPAPYSVPLQTNWQRSEEDQIRDATHKQVKAYGTPTLGTNDVTKANTHNVAQKLERSEQQSITVAVHMMQDLDAVRRDGSLEMVNTKIPGLVAYAKEENGLQLKELKEAAALAKIAYDDDNDSVEKAAEQSLQTHTEDHKVAATLAKLSAAESAVIQAWEDTRPKHETQGLDLGESNDNVPSELFSAQHQMEKEMKDIEPAESERKTNRNKEVRKMVQHKMPKTQSNAISKKVYRRTSKTLVDMEKFDDKLKKDGEKEIVLDAKLTGDLDVGFDNA